MGMQIHRFPFSPLGVAKVMPKDQPSLDIADVPLAAAIALLHHGGWYGPMISNSN